MASEEPRLGRLLRKQEICIGSIQAFCDICGILADINDTREASVLDYKSEAAWKNKSHPRQLFILACTPCWNARMFFETINGKLYPPPPQSDDRPRI
ncbi:MAG: hypothetical protein AAB362_00410 [Patescibacteria group bacterium]